MMGISAFLRHVARLAGLNETRCAACREPYVPDPASGSLPGGEFSAIPGLCPDCARLMPRRLAGCCPLCGEIAVLAAAPPTPCGHCLERRPPWAEFRFYGVFHGELRQILHRAKFRHDMACLNILGNMLAVACADLSRPDAIVPMPLHPGRLRARGYNQCREMARPLSRELGCPVRDDLLLRPRHTKPQTGLSRAERHDNLRGVFAASSEVAGLSLLLIDDTATTGTSLRMAAETLIRAGAARVDAAVVAHASLHHAEKDEDGRGVAALAFSLK